MSSLLTLEDILDNDAFCRQRPQLLPKILALKKLRRLHIGDHATLTFETKQLVWWQIQEMLRVEKGGQDQARDELEAYTPLIPSPHHLTATLMLEFPDPIERKKCLSQLIGIEKCIFLCFGSHQIEATPLAFSHPYEPSAHKTTSVHFLDFAFSPQEVETFCTNFPSPRLTITHPSYQRQTMIEAPLWASLTEQVK